MKRELINRLEARFDSHDIRRQLHDVPPHEVYEVSVDGRRAVYKTDTGPTGNAGIEGRVMAFVGEHTSIPVPETLLVGEEFYVAAWHEDAPSLETEQEANEVWARVAGSGLAKLHDETAPLLDTYGAFRPEEGLGIEGNDEWHAAATEYVRSQHPVLAQYGHADVVERVLAYLDEHPDAFAGADGPVCCHGWATPEHLAVADGEMVSLIDFEHAMAAPSEYDYWRTVIPTFGPQKSDARAVFRESYESVRPLPDGLEERRPQYALLNELYYLESLYVQSQHGKEETADIAKQIQTRVTEMLDRLS